MVNQIRNILFLRLFTRSWAITLNNFTANSSYAMPAYGYYGVVLDAIKPSLTSYLPIKSPSLQKSR